VIRQQCGGGGKVEYALEKSIEGMGGPRRQLPRIFPKHDVPHKQFFSKGQKSKPA